jgi:hypothetical protein
MLLLVGPLIDQAITQKWVLDYTWTQPAVQQLLLSCALAVLVNTSQFMCLGRFSAVSFQVRLPAPARDSLACMDARQQMHRAVQPVC